MGYEIGNAMSAMTEEGALKMANAVLQRQRRRPDILERLPDIEWSHINRPGERRIECWRSSGFLVQVFAEKDGVERLTISRTSVKGDRWADEISWDDLQRLKRECGRGERDAVEIYPDDRDTVNVANMRHLWLPTAELPFKWKTRR